MQYHLQIRLLLIQIDISHYKKTIAIFVLKLFLRKKSIRSIDKTSYNLNYKEKQKIKKLKSKKKIIALTFSKFNAKSFAILFVNKIGTFF